MKDINVPPGNEDLDPIYGFRAYSLAFASGCLPVSTAAYSQLASSRLVALAKPDSDKPRPVGITGVFHRLGMKALLMAPAEDLGAYFSDLRKYGTGVGL